MPGNDLNVLIKTILLPPSAANIKEVEKEVQNKVNSKTKGTRVKVDADTNPLLVQMRGMYQQLSKWEEQNAKVFGNSEANKTKRVETEARKQAKIWNDYNRQVMSDKQKLVDQETNNAEKIKNAYNRQFFDEFNKSLGIGVSNPSKITAQNSALKEYYENLNKVGNKVVSLKTSDVINDMFKTSKNNINESNSALKEYYAGIDKISKVVSTKTVDAINGNFANFDSNKITKENSALAQLFDNVDKGKKNFSELEKQIVGMNPAIKEFGRATKEVDSIFTTFFKDLGKLAIWGLAASAVYTPLREIRDAVNFVNEIDNAMNEVRIVTNKTQAEVMKLAGSYNELAKQMNVTTTEIAKTSADLYRQGLNDTQVEERMKGIIQYAKISSISLDDSQKIITATANATGESVQKIIDIFALLGDTTASGKHMCPAA